MLQQESFLFRNNELLYWFLFPHEKFTGRLQGPHPSSRATKLPNPLYALLVASPPVDSEGKLLATIRHPLHTFVGVLAWRRGASSSSCGGCCFTFVILVLLQCNKGWFKLVMDCFDAVISIQVEEGFWVFVCGGFGCFP